MGEKAKAMAKKGDRQIPSALRESGGGVLRDDPADSGGGVLRDPFGSGPSQMPQAALPAPPQLVAPQMGMNFQGGGALSGMMGMMGAMSSMAGPGGMGGFGGMGGPAMGGPSMAAGPTPEEMAAASMQFQRMQQAFMAGAGQAFPGANAGGGMPAAFAPSAPTSNVPAAFAKRAH